MSRRNLHRKPLSEYLSDVDMESKSVLITEESVTEEEGVDFETLMHSDSYQDPSNESISDDGSDDISLFENTIEQADTENCHQNNSTLIDDLIQFFILFNLSH